MTWLLVVVADAGLVEGNRQFLSVEDASSYCRFSGPPTVEEIDRFFVLDDRDRELIGKRRRDSSRMGFAIQLTTVRFLGAFLDDPIDVPVAVLDCLADQLGVADTSCVRRYVERDNTKWEHRRQICREVGWREYAEISQDLAQWLDHRSWNSGESSRVLFWGAVGWLRKRMILLPGINTLITDVRRARRAADERLWSRLVDQVSTDRSNGLLRLMDVSAESKKSALELLRRGPVDRTGKALVEALDRITKISQVGVSGVDIGVVPQRRVRELARDGMIRNATALRRRLPREKQLATLLAAVVYLEAKATDDALELFDVIMTNELLARAERQSKTEKLSRYPRLSRDAGRLAAAVAVLLEAQGTGQEPTLEMLWAAIDSVVPRSQLEASVANVNGLILTTDGHPDGEWRAALTSRYPLVRKFLRPLVETVEFGATADSTKVLAAFQTLPDMLSANPTRRVPRGCLDALKVDADVVTAGWRSLVYRKDGPPGTVDRDAYVFCVLEQLHQSLKRRDIFAAASSRWSDPRAQLLTGERWASEREELLDSLQLPEQPDELFDSCDAELDGVLVVMVPNPTADSRGGCNVP